MSTNRVIITGGPKTGKTTLAEKLGAKGIRIRSSDDLLPDDPKNPRVREIEAVVAEQRRAILALPQKEQWSATSATLADSWLAIPGPWCFEGVVFPRALRKWLDANPTGKPCDRIVWLSQVHAPRLPGAEVMAARMVEVMTAIVPELVKRGVIVQGFNPDAKTEAAKPASTVPAPATRPASKGPPKTMDELLDRLGIDINDTSGAAPVTVAEPAPVDTWRDRMIAQGYVPPGCRLNGQLVWGLINKAQDPCAGCNENRALCGGRPKRGA